MRRIPGIVFRFVLGLIGDHPLAANMLIGAVSIGYAVWVTREPRPALAGLATHGVDLALGMLAVSGLLAGFVGVVVVFGLQSVAPVFVRFRVESGASLSRSWLALISTGFVSASAAMLSAVGYALGLPAVGHGSLLLSVLLAIHCGVRMLWLMDLLIKAVDEDDKRKDSRGRPKRSAAETYNPAP